MRYLLTLNMVSILYALMMFIPVQLIGNIYRISRLTGWDIDTLNMLISIVIIVLIILNTFLLIFLTKNWMKGRMANLWTVILWIPYYILLSYIYVNVIPITYEGDYPNPVTGIFIIGAYIVFPLYILLINVTGMINNKNPS